LEEYNYSKSSHCPQKYETNDSFQHMYSMPCTVCSEHAINISSYTLEWYWINLVFIFCIFFYNTTCIYIIIFIIASKESWESWKYQSYLHRMSENQPCNTHSNSHNHNHLVYCYRLLYQFDMCGYQFYIHLCL
jgi:hypothetical protein